MAAEPRVVRVEAPSPPGWVTEALGAVRSSSSIQGPLRVQRHEGTGATLLQATVEEAAELPPLALQRRVAEAYAWIGRAIERAEARRPVRFWNYVPGIGRPIERDLDRYMVFNAGRFAAYTGWFGTAELGDHLTAATAVDGRSAALVVQALLLDGTARPVENRRQVPAYRYSARYGPVPPCFARATVLEPGVGAAMAGAVPPARILVAGTASVVGEASTHPEDLHGQVRETLRNLAAIVAEARRAAAGGTEAAGPPDQARLLRCFRSLRVYLVRPADDLEEVAALLREAMPQLGAIEVMAADLCRPDLRVEIEGVARAGDETEDELESRPAR